MKKTGHALHEYALVIALLALLSIGALQLLGGNIDSLLKRTSDPKTLAETEKLYGLIGADIDGQGGGNQPGGAQLAGPTPSLATLKINPETGRVMITAASSGGTNATSVGGDSLMAMASTQLGALANLKAPDGKPLPDDVQTLLKRLSYSGTELSKQYAGFSAYQPQIEQLHRTVAEQQRQGQQGGPPYYDAAFVAETMHYTDQYIQFSQSYQQLEAELAQLDKQSPAYAELQKQVEQYAGSISGLAFHEIGEPFYSQFHIGNVKPEDLGPALAKNPTAAQYFQQLETRAASLPAGERENVFRTGVVSLAEQMMVGAPLESGIQLTFSLPTDITGLKTSSNRSE